MRGAPMGMRGGFHPGMRGRHILRGLPPRGMGFHHRSGPPRGGAPPNGMGQPPMYKNQGYYHQVYPPPNHNSAPPQQSQPASARIVTISTSTTTSSEPVTLTPATVSQSTQTTSPQTIGVSSGTTPSVSTTGASRGDLRGRGVSDITCDDCSCYTPNTKINVSGNDMSSSGTMPTFIQPDMTQGDPVLASKRGAPMGIAEAKRGRHEQGPLTRPYAPKYPSVNQQQVPTHTPQHNSYHNPSLTQRYVICTCESSVLIKRFEVFTVVMVVTNSLL